MGPVFIYEWVTAARRWQMYALGSLFVAALLFAVMLVWVKNVEPSTQFGPDRKAYEKMGEAIFYAFVGTQLAVILLAAPAATAGSVCLDKARGNLLHLLVTDLTSREIIVGKLCARLIPTLGLVLSSVPVLMACGWFGGLDLGALLGAYTVTAGVAVFGCSLTLLLSVWGRKTHEVLIGAYVAEALILLAYGAALMIEEQLRLTRGALSGTMFWTNPFVLAYAPYLSPGAVEPADYAWFLGACLALSAVCTALGIVTVRPVTVRHGSVPQKQSRRRAVARLRRPWTPTLDKNPVLWREWHRQRPSRWTRIVWLIYGVVAALATFSLALSALFKGTRNDLAGMAAFTTGMQVSVGLLLVSVSAVTALSEERVRGTLDLLMATPLKTKEIVWGKWRGAFRIVPWLAALPVVNVFILAAGTGRWFSIPFMVALVFSYGAAVTSLGLALATWIKRLGRATAASAAAYALVTVGWLATVGLIFSGGGGHETFEALASASPFFGPGQLAFETGEPFTRHITSYTCLPVWIAVAVAAASILYLLTLATFDHCLGRVQDSLPRYAPTRLYRERLPSAPVPALGSRHDD